MNKILIAGLFTLTASLALFSGCQPAGSGNQGGTTGPGENAVKTAAAISSAPDTTTLKGDWYLQDFSHTPVNDPKTTYIRFNTEKSSFNGNTGCNSVSGVFWYSDSDTSLVFADHFAMTRMSCPGSNEQALIKSLRKINHYCLKNGRLTLLSDSTEVSGWTRTPPSGKLARS